MPTMHRMGETIFLLGFIVVSATEMVVWPMRLVPFVLNCHR